MEKPVPDLIYYEKVVNNKHLTEEHVRYELEELISDVKVYMGKIQEYNRKRNFEINKKNLFNTIDQNCGIIVSVAVVILIMLMFCV